MNINVIQDCVHDSILEMRKLLIMETKETNPKEAVGGMKFQMSCVPMLVMAEVSVAMAEGALKYGRHNWRQSGAKSSVYFDAAMRHLISFWEGEESDPESGLPHIVKVISSLCVLRDAQIHETDIDDRPINKNATEQIEIINETHQMIQGVRK